MIIRKKNREKFSSFNVKQKKLTNNPSILTSIPQPNFVVIDKMRDTVRLRKTVGPKTRIKLVNRKLSYFIGSQFRSDDFLYHTRSKERMFNSMMVAQQHTFARFAKLCRVYVKNLLTMQDPDLMYIVAHLKYIHFYFKNEFYTFLFSKFPSFFKRLSDILLPIKKQHHFFFKKNLSFGQSRMTKRLFYKKQNKFSFILMYTKLHFIVCRSMQFFFAAYVKSLSYNFFYIKPDFCWDFFMDKDFVYLADFVQKDVSKLKVIGSKLETNLVGDLFFDTGLNTIEKHLPLSFHETTKEKYKTKFPNSLPVFNFPIDRLDDTDEVFTEVVRKNQRELIKRSFNFRYYLRGYFKLIYSFVKKKYKPQEYQMTPPPKNPHFEFIGTLPRFYPVYDTLTAPLPQNRKYDFETFFTVLPTAPYYGGLIEKIFFKTDLLLNFYKKTGEKPDILVGDLHHITFYKIPFGEKQANITITEQNLFTIDNFQRNKSSWCFFRQLWKTQVLSYSRFEHEINFWNFKQGSFSEELITFFYNNMFSVNYMDPHLGRAVNHYKRLLDIEFTENKYLEEVYDSLFPWVQHVETMWNLIIEALDDFKGSKFFDWLKHTKTSKAYDAQTLIQPIFARIKSIPKYSPYFYMYYYPILDLSQTTVLPHTSFRLPHFKRKILITQEFAHNFHIQSFFRFARVLIRKGFKKRALRMLRYCLIHLKKKYACYSSSNMLLGAVKKATPDLIQMPFLKGKVKENSIIPARSIRRFSEGVRNLYNSARFRRIHLDWGLDFFVGKKFEHVLAEEIIDVIKDKYDCTTLRLIRHNLVGLTQLGRSRYTRKVGVVKYTPYDFAEESLQYIFSEKPKKYEIAEERTADFIRVKKKPFTAPFLVDNFWKKKVKLRRLLYNKPNLRQRYEKQYGFNKIQQFSKQKVQLKKNKFSSQIKKKHSS